MEPRVPLMPVQGLLGLFELDLNRLQELLLPLRNVAFLLGEHADIVGRLLLGNIGQMVVDGGLPCLLDLVTEGIEFVCGVLLL